MMRKLKAFLFENKTVRQTVLKNTFWLSFGEIVGRILRTGVVIAAARVLGAEGWGVFSYIVSISALFTIFSDIGLSTILTREVARSPEKQDAYFSTIFFLKTSLVAISAAALFLGIPLISRIPIPSALLVGIALMFILDSFRNYGIALIRAKELMQREALVNVVTQAVILIAGSFVLLRSASPQALAFAYATGSAAGLALALYFIAPYLKTILSHINLRLARSIIAAAWPFGIAGLLGAVMINTDTVLLGWFKSATEVGFYAAAQKPITLLYIFPSLIAGGFFPVLSRLAHTDNNRLRAMLERGIAAVYLIAIPLSIGIFLTAHQIINILYGSAYVFSVLPLRILALTLLTMYPISLIANTLFAYRKHKTFIAYSAIGAIGNVIFDILFIPAFGAVGSAAATLLTQIAANSFLWIKIRKVNTFTVLPHLPKIFIASSIMGIGVLIAVFLNISFFITVPVAAILYFGILSLLKERTIVELRQLFSN